MPENTNPEDDLFEAALLRSSGPERAAFLDGECRSDPALRARVEMMLEGHLNAEGFLEALPERAPAQETVASSGSNGSEQLGSNIGPYKLLQKLGEGGCGLVYLAEQQQPVRRRVALKVIKLGMDTRNVIARFEAERQALALMDHPNIAKVFDAGVTETGRPYFVMELVRGIRISEYCDLNNLPTDQRLSIFIQVCHAIQHAHQKGIIHRDIKPSNILITLHDGVPVPKVIDFGIAKATCDQHLTDKTIFTAFEQFIGTPAYMSPEQAEMSGLDIDTRSDIYSLGVLLYELLTGSTPFDAKELLASGLDAMRKTIREKEAVRPSTKFATLQGEELATTAKRRSAEPSRLVHQLKGDLDWIIMKCLEKDRTRRYETANGLAADLKRHLSDEPVVARPPSSAYRFQKAFRRNKLVFAAGAAVSAALLIGIIASTWQAVRATHAKREAVSAQAQAVEAQASEAKLRRQAETARKQEADLRSRAELAERETEQQLYYALLEQTRATVKSGEMGHRVRALEALRRAAAISNTVELRREVFAALALPDLRFERELPYGSDFTLRRLDPSFERIALCRGSGPVEIRSTSDQRVLVTLPASTNLAAYVAEWSAHGRFLAVKRDYPRESSGRADWEIWEVPAARRVMLLQDVSRGVVSFHPGEQRLLVPRRMGVAVWDLNTAREVRRFQLGDTPAWGRFAPDGERFAALCATNGVPTVWVHDLTDGALLASHPFFSPAFAVNFNWHPAGRGISVTDASGGVHWMDAQTGQTRVLGRHNAEAVETGFSPDGAYIISGGWDNQLICWDVKAMQRAFTIGLGSWVAHFRTDGRAFAVTTPSGVQLHTFERSSGFREFGDDLEARLGHAAFSPDGRWLAASTDKRAGVWDLIHGGPGAFDDDGYDAHFFFTPDGRELFGSGSRQGRADLQGESDCFRWRIMPGTNASAPPRIERLPLRKPTGFTFLSLSSNSVVMTGTNGSQLLAPEELETGKDQWASTHSGITGVSPDGRWLAIYRPFTPLLYVYRLPKLERVAKLTHPSSIGDFEFSPVGDEVAISSSRAGIEFWSTATWTRTRALTNFIRILYAPDPRALWLTKDLRTAGLYDAHTLEPRLLLPTGMRPMAVSPDGRHLAVSVDARRLQVLDLVEVRERFRELGLDWASPP